MADEIKDTIPVILPKIEGSVLFGVSSRAVIAILLVSAVCIMSVFGIPVVEPLYTLALTATAYYFGHTVGSSTKTKL